MKVVDILENAEVTDTSHHKLITDPHRAYHYAKWVIRGRWKEAEPYIMKNPQWAYGYAREVINMGKTRRDTMIRWPEAEPYIMTDPEFAYHYAKGVIRGRWKEAEPYIMKNPQWAYSYAKGVINMGKTRKNKMIRWEEAEPYIMKDPRYACEYAKDVIKGRWPAAEPIIMKDPKWAYNYAKDAIEGRWPEAEPYIMKDPGWSWDYTNDIIVPSLKLDQPRSPDQIRELLTDESLIKMNKLVYDDIVKRFFPRSSLLVDRWVGYGNHIRQRKPRGAKS